jgi:hypothetical protein
MTPAEISAYQQRVRELAEQRKELTMEEYTVDVTPLTPEEYRARLTRVIDAVRNDPEIRARNVAWREAQGGIAGVMRRAW